jgi:endogenous inhibitor of DNA gyrase (YacG/DUF329 family)
MQLKSKRKPGSRFYNVKERTDGKWTLCPICDKELTSCHLGAYCSGRCGYVDGIILLTEKQAKKLKDKLE